MLPVLAITRPSSGVPTKRLSREPGCPAWGRPATNGPPFEWRCMYASSFANANGVTRLPAASPEPSSSANAVESIFTESVRNPRSTPRPADHDPLGSDGPAAPRPEEIVADRGGRLGGDRASAVLERDHAGVRGPGDYRWRVDAGTGVDAEVHAVVVEAESRHGSRIPPGEVPG